MQNTQSSEAPRTLDDPDSDKLPLNGGSAFTIYAQVSNKTVLFSSTLGGQTYTGLKWNRTSTSTSVALTFMLSSDIQYFTSESAELVFDPAADGHQKASCAPDSNNREEYHFDAYVNDPENGGKLIQIIDPVIVISIKP